MQWADGTSAVAEARLYSFLAWLVFPFRLQKLLNPLILPKAIRRLLCAVQLGRTTPHLHNLIAQNLPRAVKKSHTPIQKLQTETKSLGMILSISSSTVWMEIRLDASSPFLSPGSAELQLVQGTRTGETQIETAVREQVVKLQGTVWD